MVVVFILCAIIAFLIKSPLLLGLSFVSFILSIPLHEKKNKERTKAIMAHEIRRKEEERRRQQIAKNARIRSGPPRDAERNQRRALEEAKRRERAEKERAISKQKIFAAQQRRLLSNSMRYEVLRRDGFRCVLCGASAKDGAALHVDHIFPVSKGGKTEMSNLRTLCDRCNLGKGAKIEAENDNPGKTKEQLPGNKPMIFISLDSLKRKLDTIKGVKYLQYETFRLEVDCPPSAYQVLSDIVVIGYQKTSNANKWIFEREL